MARSKNTEAQAKLIDAQARARQVDNDAELKLEDLRLYAKINKVELPSDEQARLAREVRQAQADRKAQQDEANRERLYKMFVEPVLTPIGNVIDNAPKAVVDKMMLFQFNNALANLMKGDERISTSKDDKLNKLATGIDDSGNVKTMYEFQTSRVDKKSKETIKLDVPINFEIPGEVLNSTNILDIQETLNTAVGNIRRKLIDFREKSEKLESYDQNPETLTIKVLGKNQVDVNLGSQKNVTS